MNKKIAFLGVGKIGEALLSGSINGGVPSDKVVVTTRSIDHLNKIKNNYGIAGMINNEEAVKQAEIIVIATPSNTILKVISEIYEYILTQAVLIFLTDEYSLEFLQEKLPKTVGVVKAMPNLASKVGKGFTLLTMGSNCTLEQINIVKNFFIISGEILIVSEEDQKKLAPLSSGGMAYIMYVVDALIEGNAIRGVARNVSKQISTQILMGANELIKSNPEETVDSLRSSMCSPGGIGAKRIAMLDKQGVRSAFIEAISKEY